MNKTLSLASLLLLAACGGGGSDGPAPTPVAGPPAPNPSATPSANPATGPVSGYTLHSYDDGTGHGTREIARGPLSGGDLNTLRLNGQDYQIKVPGLKADPDNHGLLTHEDGNRETKRLVARQLIPGLRYSQVGAITFGRDFDRSGFWYYIDNHYFHQGLTPGALPSGRARYEGTAYLSSYGDGDLNNTRAGAHFDVDFNAKTLSGRLDNRVELDYDDIRDGFSFTGTIQGTGFSAHQDKIFYSGGFYGPNAEELGGFMRHDEDKVSGFFAAHKQ